MSEIEDGSSYRTDFQNISDLLNATSKSVGNKKDYNKQNDIVSELLRKQKQNSKDTQKQWPGDVKERLQYNQKMSETSRS